MAEVLADVAGAGVASFLCAIASATDLRRISAASVEARDALALLAAAPFALKEAMSESREASSMTGRRAVTPASEREVAAAVAAREERRGGAVTIAGNAATTSSWSNGSSRDEENECLQTP